MKLKIMLKRFFIILLALFIGCRMILPFFFGQFGPDEGLFALRAYQWVKCSPSLTGMVGDTSASSVIKDLIPPCGTLSLKGLVGRLGISYGPYLSYWLDFLYTVTGFNLAVLYALSGTVFILPAFILAKVVKDNNPFPEKEEAMYITVFLLSVTSPLAVYFSLMPLWDTPWLIFFSVLLLFFGMKAAKSGSIANLVLGLGVGMVLVSHLQTIPFITGFVVWDLFTVRQRRKFFIFLSGVILTSGFYFARLFTVTEKFMVGILDLNSNRNYWNIISSLGNLFAFWGNSQFTASSPSIVLSRVQASLSFISTCMGIFMAMLLGYCFFRNRRRFVSFPPLLQLSFFILAVYIPFNLITGASSEMHENMSLWWFAPLMMVYLVRMLFEDRTAKKILSTLVLFNVIAVAAYLVPAVIDQSGRGQLVPGINWRAQKEAVLSVCGRGQISYRGKQYAYIDTTNPHKHMLSLSLPAMVLLTDPSCARNTVFTDEEINSTVRIQEQGGKLRVEYNK